MNIVYKTIPIHTAEDVPIDQMIEIYFMRDIVKTTLNEDTIILLNITEQKVEPVKVDYRNRTLKVKPVSKLMPKNHYQLQIVGGKDGIKDIVGWEMAQTYEVEFYTKDVESIKPPRILFPVDLSVVDKAVEFQMESAAYADHYEIQVSKSNTFHNLVWPTGDEKVFKLEEVRFTPDIDYQEGQYYMRARSVSVDGEKSSWSSAVRYFYQPVLDYEPVEEETVESKEVFLQTNSRPGSNITQLEKLQDVFAEEKEENNPFQIKRVTPGDGTVHNGLEKARKIVIEFSEEIDPDSVFSSNCYVLSERN